jgi:Domain of unknown function (DUF932)
MTCFRARRSDVVGSRWDVGTRFSELMAPASVCRLRRLDWELKRLPVQFLIHSKLRVMDDRFVLARSDTGAALSVVSGDYHIVQPKDVLEFFRDLVASFHYTLETAGALNGGRKVWALAKTGKTAIVACKHRQPRPDCGLDDRFHETDHIGCHHSLLVNRHFAGTC